MHAIIKTGGKQYRVAEGQVLRVETLNTEVGNIVDFDQVLMVSDAENTQVGAPLVTNAKVKGQVMSHGRAKKIDILKFKRRKHHMKHMGHRQNFTEIKITAIEA